MKLPLLILDSPFGGVTRILWYRIPHTLLRRKKAFWRVVKSLKRCESVPGTSRANDVAIGHQGVNFRLGALDEHAFDTIESWLSIVKVLTRLLCTRYGLCGKCYGALLGRGTP